MPDQFSSIYQLHNWPFVRELDDLEEEAEDGPEEEESIFLSGRTRICSEFHKAQWTRQKSIFYANLLKNVRKVKLY